ncbi:MAG: hypothetical protein KBD78_03110 [Oligoflexales bacterium]|nr:hypothetical protein [Oligoflexales bacterium]
MLALKSTLKTVKRQLEFPAFNISFESGIWKKQSAWDLTTKHLFFQHAAEFEVLSSRDVWVRGRSKSDRCCIECQGDAVQRWALQFAQSPETLAFAQCQEVLQHFRILYLQCFFLTKSSLSAVAAVGFEEFNNKSGFDFYLHSFNLLISAAFLLKDADLIYSVPQGVPSQMDQLICGKSHEFWVPSPLFSKGGQFKLLKVKEISREEWFKRPEFEFEKENLKNLLRRKKAKQTNKEQTNRIRSLRKKTKAGLLSRIFFPK